MFNIAQYSVNLKLSHQALLFLSEIDIENYPFTKYRINRIVLVAMMSNNHAE